jgi:hypothetical protein
VSRITGVNVASWVYLRCAWVVVALSYMRPVMVGLRVNRCEPEALWSYVGKKQKNVTQRELAVKGDAYTFVVPAPPAISLTAPASATPTIRWSLSHDLRERVIGSPEISADGVHPYKVAIRNAFGRRIVHGIITKTCSATHLAVKDAARRAIHRLR